MSFKRGNPVAVQHLTLRDVSRPAVLSASTIVNSHIVNCHLGMTTVVLQSFETDQAAGAAGLRQGDLYRDGSGHVLVKL